MNGGASWNMVTSGNMSKKPVLFLHGFLGSGAEWQPILKGCRKYYCLCPDLPGHGKTRLPDAPEGYRMERVAHALLDELDTCGVDQAALVGYSMGGRLALYLALEHAERFPVVVLESASPGLKTEEEQDARRAADEALAQRLEAIAQDRRAYREFLKEWLCQPLFGPLARDGRALEQLVRRRLHHDPVQLAEALRGLSVSNQPNLWPRLGRHRNPTLLMVGEEDHKFRFIAEEMCGLCSQMAMQSLSGCGHNVHLGDSAGYSARLWHFLGQVW